MGCVSVKGSACPSCGEPAGKKFQGSGSEQTTFNCLKCGKKQEIQHYFECKQCNSIICSQCPKIKHENYAKCPSCWELAGKKFKGSGNNQLTFNCFKCGMKKEKENYYECNKCNCIFCSQCPQIKNENLVKCPSCGENAGRNFKGSKNALNSFYCLKCGKKQETKHYYECNKCNSIFCNQCPQIKNDNLSKCPSCGQYAGEGFKGSGNNQLTFYCLKCGKKKDKENYYECNKCYCIFCSQCPQIRNENLAKCPSCGESAGKTFKGSGNNVNSFYCLKCGKKKTKKIIMNAINVIVFFVVNVHN